MDKLKNAGGMVAGFLLLLLFLALPIIFLMGAASFSLWALEWIPSTIGLAVFACVALIPLAIIPMTRGYAGRLFSLASLVFGVSLWLYGLAFTYIEWGLIGVVLGILVFGVGVVITAILAAIFSGSWIVLGNLAFLFGLFVIANGLGAWMRVLAEDRRMRKAMRSAPSTVTLTQGSED